ncbi:GGDEF domain-containing protein [Marinobacterium nitratireducens]|uniref:diguanylate cyclase n=1 Tax=Marinobacterium nitratireducens TaxID=518897 RepID=A0A918DMW0_9GAMM|nr:GGDEF domain-containing protein [Marinobacterium nitratireducens]GGO75751.1 GGDEF domain-containing protein [Marinobacterium nitratireducens]
MKFVENSSQAAAYLRQAVPMMVKYNIPPNPLNYALWYTYVSNRLPDLNSELDEALVTYGTCPMMISEQLFRDHMLRDELESAKDMQANLISLMNDLHHQADATARRTSSYSEVLQDSLDALNESDNERLPLESIIQNLALNTAAISAETRQFQLRIDEARAEIDALRAELVQSRHDARIDPLTSLFNRRVFDAEIEQLLGTADRPRLTLIMLDVDHFKAFNDLYGHLMGDKVLQYVGKLLKEQLQDPALPVRFGGEEFAVLIPNAGLEQCLDTAELLREKIQAIRIKLKKSGEVISSITASFGVAEYRDGDSIDDFIGRADQALYDAKEGGRNRVEAAG